MNVLNNLSPDNSLLTTKITIPLARTTLVARQELIQRLYEGMRCRLTLISAPAGFGKTTLLSQWLTASPSIATAWVSLDKGDNEPVRFWLYFVTALEPLQPGMGEYALSLQDTAQTLAAEPLLTTLINTLAAIPYDIVIILDDYHLIENEEIHDGIAFLLDHLPANVHLFIASRSDPPLPLARLRTRDQLNELRIADLRFSVAEATTFLYHALGVELATADVVALEARTEGWVAGLQLAALSMKGRENISEFIASFTGSHRYIVNYLAEEVLSRQPDYIHAFLLHTSMLERLNADLCNTLTQRADSQQILEELERTNLFVVPLDDEQHWYRYHHLFAEVLRHRLQRLQPELIPELHRRASRWYEQHTKIYPAIEHALAAGDFEHAADMIELVIEELTKRGEMATLRRWAEMVPETLLRSRLRLFASHIWTLISGGQWEKAENRLEEVEARLAAAGDLKSFQTVVTNIMSARIAIAYYRGNVPLTIELSQQALALTPNDNPHRRAGIMLYQAGACWFNGDLVQAQQLLAEVLKLCQEHEHLYFTLITMYMQAEIERVQSHLHIGYRLCQQALQFARDHNVLTSAMIGNIYLCIAGCYLEWNELETATYYTSECSKLALQSGDYFLAVCNYITLSRIKQAQRNFVEAQELLLTATRISKKYVVAHFTSQLAAQRARLDLDLGDNEAAIQWAQKISLPVADRPAVWQETELFTLARVFTLQRRYSEAQELLQKYLVTKKVEGDSGIRIVVLLALNFQAQGDITQAVATLMQALAIAEPEGYIRIFANEGEPMITLLLEVLTAQQKKQGVSLPRVSPAYIQQLLGVLGIPVEVANETTTQNGDESLSERELEVLRLIASGMSNQQIAEKLIIAASTLKTHINHIYGKLNVRSRTQAIVQARKSNLL